MVRDINEIIWLPRGFEFLCGLPEHKRRKRHILAFQTFIDDSGTKGRGKILMLGGLFGSAEAFASVADNWDRELRANVPLPIRYFKAYEASGLSGEFSHWQRRRRDEKVRRLASVIDRNDLVVVYGGVDLAAHSVLESREGRGVTDAKRHPYNQPYLLALLTLTLAVGMEMWHRQSEEKLEMILDDHPVFREDAKAHYKVLREVVPKWLLKYLPVEPWFRDDKDFVVLQAADLMMGHARMIVEKSQDWPSLEFKNLLVSPFSKYYWAGRLAQLEVASLARRFNVPENASGSTPERRRQ